MTYLASFAVSALFAYLANEANKRHKIVLFSFFSIAIPVILAGLRDYRLGIDVLNYLTMPLYWINGFHADSLLEYLNFYFSQRTSDPLFALLLGSVAQLTKSYRCFLFVCHAIIMTFTYIGIYRFRKQVNPAFVLLVFYLFFYNHSLNIMRQYIAMSILFAFLADIPNKKYLRYVIAAVVATLFHSTAILGIAPLILYFLLNLKTDKIKITTTATLPQRSVAIAGTLFLGVLLFNPLVTLLVNIGLLNSRFLYYLKDGAVSPALLILGIALIGLLGVYYFRKEIKAHFNDSYFFIMCSTTYAILLLLTFTIPYGKRIALYFAMADLVTLGLVQNVPKSKKAKTIVTGALLGIALLYWIYVYALQNASRTFPYIFFFTV